MHTIIVLPTYNEAKNLRPIGTALLALPDLDLAVLVVDDDSPDGTGAIADELVEEFPGRIQVLHRKEKAGLGAAYRAGFRSAIEMGAQYIGQMDADFSHSPDYLPEMIGRLADYDVVIGSRYVKGGRTDERWEWGRYMLSWFANSVYTRTILRLAVKDATAGFKIWRRETLLSLGLHRVRSNGYIFQVEMAYLVERLGFRAFEIPIYFEDRRIGHSKMTIPVKLEAALRTFELAWRYRNFSPADRVVTPSPSPAAESSSAPAAD